jgi:hypothetical protein
MSRLRRSTIPSTVIRLSQVTWPARARAALARAAGRRGRVEVYFAFDDAASAVAVPDLVERLASRRVDVVLLPVVRRGIAGDPAVQDKRRHALADARRRGLDATVEDPGDVTHLARWAATGAPNDAVCDALRAVWRGEPFPVDAPGGDEALRRNERRMRRRGPYDTPAAVVGGRWYFAHDRAEQVADWVDELGWAA